MHIVVNGPTDDEDLALLQRVIAGLEADIRAELPLDRARQRVVGARTMAVIIERRHTDGAVMGSEVRQALDHITRLCNKINRTLAASA
jgi:hypothetical protein